MEETIQVILVAFMVMLSLFVAFCVAPLIAQLASALWELFFGEE